MGVAPKRKNKNKNKLSEAERNAPLTSTPAATLAATPAAAPAAAPAAVVKAAAATKPPVADKPAKLQPSHIPAPSPTTAPTTSKKRKEPEPESAPAPAPTASSKPTRSTNAPKRARVADANDSRSSSHRPSRRTARDNDDDDDGDDDHNNSSLSVPSRRVPAQASTISAKSKPKPNPMCFLDFAIGNRPAGRVIFELFKDAAPLAVENFRALCTGEKGTHGPTGKALHYKDTVVHRVTPGIAIEAGDILSGDGTGNVNAFHDEPSTFQADPPTLQHTQFGTLSTAAVQHASSQFIITLGTQRMAFLDARHTVFGRCVRGAGVLREVERAAAAAAAQASSASSSPAAPIRIVDCGRMRKTELNEEVKRIEATAEAKRTANMVRELHQRAKEEAKKKAAASESSNGEGEDGAGAKAAEMTDGENEEAATATNGTSTDETPDLSTLNALPNGMARDMCTKCGGPLKYVQRTKKGLRMRCKDAECGHAMYVEDRRKDEAGQAGQASSKASQSKAEAKTSESSQPSKSKKDAKKRKQQKE